MSKYRVYVTETTTQEYWKDYYAPSQETAEEMGENEIQMDLGFPDDWQSGYSDAQRYVSRVNKLETTTTKRGD